MKGTDISAFIVNYNTRELLERAIESLRRTEGNFGIEIFIADNHSSDGSARMVRERFPEVTLIELSQNVGYTAAINPLLKSGQGSYYLLLHPDIELLPNTLERFVTFFESCPKAGILGGNLYYPDGTPNPCEISYPSFKNDLLNLAARVYKRMSGTRRGLQNGNRGEWSHRLTCQVNWVWNACMMVRREVFTEVGFFDEDFFVWYSDWDFCKRAADAGWEVYYLHPAMAIHYERYSFGLGNVPTEDVLYKVDGWYSAARQIEDRGVFLRKHLTPISRYGVKAIYLAESLLRFWLIMARLIVQKTSPNRTKFQTKVCMKTVQAIFKA